ncbi:PQQ-dependent sugar dehydrogenase [Actinoplanes sp. NPDC051494]|uniref:PQQ-dependent sugar dehydrogenase n=1 Tax=Actinoplanes sp. NPDC051494 TaxID=3363907 RepID=UPI003799B36E
MRKMFAFLLLVAFLAPVPAAAAPPPDFRTALVVGAGLDGPAGFEIAPDGRIFVLERAGRVRIVKDGRLLTTPFADLPSEATGDRGLIGIAFDPEFGVANHYVYFYYTGLDLHNRLVRFDASGDVGTGGPFTIFRTASLSQQLHVGGSIRFGPDGKLYFAVGDNGYASNGQLLTNPHGKILRINKDGSIPPDNPFAGQAGKQQEIWAYGFRNPWRFQFDSVTGRLYGGDVGDYTWEEVNHIVKGGNYGWPLKEGVCTSGCAGFTDPIYTYPHDGQSAAATGGPVYRGGMFPGEYEGNLFFGDYAKGFIRRAELDANGEVAAVHDFDATAGSVVDMKVAPDGSLYYLTYIPGRLYRISYELGNHAPAAVATADVTKGVAPLTVHFSGSGSTDPDGDPLGYAWAFGDGTTSTAADPVKIYPHTGVYVATLTVTDSEGNAAAAVPVVVQVGIAPTVTVAVPADGSRYRAGDVITYNAFASDAAGFDLDDNDIATTVVLHHGTHVHPFAGPLTGRAGSFTVPVTGESSADTWYEITVTATDTNGLSTSRSITVRPVTGTFTVATDPPGLTAYLDGVPRGTPHEVLGVAGFEREVYAPPTAVAADGTVYHFTGWSDGKGMRHVVTTPEAGATYTATYAPSAPYTATFFRGTTLGGAPLLTRTDPAVDFTWDGGSPAPEVPDDDFSARWSKKEYFAGGRYTFTAVTDDGFRLLLDGTTVLSRWPAQPGTAYDWTGDLGPGNHTITFEYFEDGGAALAKLDWAGAVEQPGDTWRADYWNAPGTGAAPAVPSSAPVLTRAEPAVNHDWARAAPGPGVDADHFVARWTRTLSLAPGEYEFTTTADDGVRLTVDGVRVVDRWADSSGGTDTARVIVDGGPHTVVMEYYDDWGEAVAKLAWRQVADQLAPQDYTAEFWTAPGPASSPPIPRRAPDLVRADPAIAFDWGGGSPVPSESFIARWTRTDTLPAGRYRFEGAADDGIRIYVDGAPVVDRWIDQNATFGTDRMLLSGIHEIRVEYYENGGGALARFDYRRVGDYQPANLWTASYFTGTALAGTPVVTRQDDTVDIDWGSGSPDPLLPADGFSARWTRTADHAAGTYRFAATGDDGIRVLLDGVTVVDGWSDHGPTTFTADVVLGAGEHTVTVEYYDSGGGALARFRETPL